MWIYPIKQGMMRTLKELNFFQKCSFLSLFILGKISKESSIVGGKKYPGKTFFIIRRDYSNVGLLSAYITNAGYIKYAIDHGYIPVVDMKHYKNCYLEKGELGKKNTWEFYFEQPTSYSLEDAYSGKNIILSDLNTIDQRPNDHMDFFYNTNNELKKWREFAREYIKVKHSIWDEATYRYKYYSKGEKTLGVSIRGTDYINLQPPEHPVQPPIEVVIADIKNELSINQYTHIYICTEDVKYIESIKEEFGDMCFINERKLIDYSKGSIIATIKKEKINKYDNGKEYLITILMLTMTDVLIASRTSGNVAAEVLSNGWEKQKIYDLGRYPKK